MYWPVKEPTPIIRKTNKEIIMGNIELDESEIKIEKYRTVNCMLNSNPKGVRVTHIETGKSVSCESGMLKENIKKAKSDLYDLLNGKILKDLELIKHAAVKSKDGWVIIGKNHAECFHKAGNMNVKMSQLREDQGFVTDTGRFINRYEAAKLAFNNGQVNKKEKMLFSEHLWGNMYNAKHEYSEIKGYILRE